ncbi:hypothetical protein [Aliikangiella coralliicola]|nr:hypothetical protein [Aliikangiella coralliicola]
MNSITETAIKIIADTIHAKTMCIPASLLLTRCNNALLITVNNHIKT